jgi:Uncharacterized protein conserved in bacteria (DUF2147)
MKRLCIFTALMLLSSAAHADNSFAFQIGGHRVHIDAPRYYRSLSCVSVSTAGVYEMASKREKFRSNNPAGRRVASTKPLATNSEPAVARPAIPPPGSKPSSDAVTSERPALPPSVSAPAASPHEPTTTPTPSIEVKPAATVLPSATPKDVPPPIPPVVLSTSPVITHDASNEELFAALGDWQTEGKKKTVRIKQCGKSLCGYVLNASSNSDGETVLVNMKPTAASEWTGSIYSHDSGNTYASKIVLKGRDSLRVEACVLGRFFCNRQVWSRISSEPEKLITSRTSREILSGR